MSDEFEVAEEFDPPLPPPTDEMTMATPDLIDRLAPDSFKPIPGFPPFEQRDLKHHLKYSDGNVSALVLRGVPGVKWQGSPWHLHDLDFQLVYITHGSMDFEFEGVGAVHLEAGAVMYQPPMNRHREIGATEDSQALLLTIPAKFKTTAYIYDEGSGTYNELTVDTDSAEAGELNSVERAEAASA
jgi:quercetin dioxygenase-like cupin family protein